MIGPGTLDAMSFLHHWLLTILLLTPAAGGFVVLLLRSSGAARRTAIGVSVGALCLSILVLVLFQVKPGSYDYAPAGTVQMSQHFEIVPAIHCNYQVAIDGLSLPFIVVTSLIAILACVSGPREREHARWFLAMILWIETAALGIFLSFDLLLLWAFLAILPIPICALPSLGRAEHRRPLVWSFLPPMLIALACLFVGALGERLMSTHCMVGGTFDLVRLASMRCTDPALFLLLLIGFLVIVPVFPLHSWVAVLARSRFPLAISMMAMLFPLIGGYGLLRVALPLFPTVAASLWWLPASLGVLMILNFSLCAMGTEDFGSAAAYVILSMNGFALVGLATLTPIGMSGALIIFLGQSLIAPSLIELTGESIFVRGGSSRDCTAFAAAVWLAELQVPGFLSQIMVLLGTMQMAGRDSVSHSGALAVAVMAAVGVVLIAAAGVRIVRRTLQAKVSENSSTAHTPLVAPATTMTDSP